MYGASTLRSLGLRIAAEVLSGAFLTGSQFGWKCRGKTSFFKADPALKAVRGRGEEFRCRWAGESSPTEISCRAKQHGFPGAACGASTGWWAQLVPLKVQLRHRRGAELRSCQLVCSCRGSSVAAAVGSPVPSCPQAEESVQGQFGMCLCVLGNK